eukprot:gene25112-biopygen19477
MRPETQKHGGCFWHGGRNKSGEAHCGKKIGRDGAAKIGDDCPKKKTICPSPERREGNVPPHHTHTVHRAWPGTGCMEEVKYFPHHIKRLR